MNAPAYLIQGNNIVVVIGNKSHTISKTHITYTKVLDAIKAQDWDTVKDIIEPKKMVATFGQGNLAIDGDVQAMADHGRQYRLDVFGQHLASTVHHGPRAGGIEQGQRRARRQSVHVIGRLAAVIDECLQIVEQRIGGVNFARIALQLDELFGLDAGGKLRQHVAPVDALQQRAIAEGWSADALRGALWDAMVQGAKPPAIPAAPATTAPAQSDPAVLREAMAEALAVRAMPGYQVSAGSTRLPSPASAGALSSGIRSFSPSASGAISPWLSSPAGQHWRPSPPSRRRRSPPIPSCGDSPTISA